MEMTIASVDYAPDDLYSQTPFVVDLIREIPGDDRPDYWLCSLRKPLTWIKDNQDHTITHITLAARWVGTQIGPGTQHLPVGIAFVTDQSLLNDEKLSLAKAAYVAIGIASDTTNGPVAPLENIISGNIAPGFNTGIPMEKTQTSFFTNFWNRLKTAVTGLGT